MAEEIRGLTVKFNADFSEFKKGMKSADKDISSTQKQLKSLQDGLKLKFDEEKFAQAQKLAQQSLTATEQKANLLKQRLAEMERVGVTNKTRDEYNYLQEQLAKTEVNAEKLEQQLKQINNIKLDKFVGNIKDVGQGITQAGMGMSAFSAMAGGTLASLYKFGQDSRKVADDIATIGTQFDVNTTSIQRWQYWALQSDVPFDKLQKGFIKARETLGKQLAGETDKSTKALDALGIKMEDFGSQEDAFEGIIKALSGVEDVTLQAHYATEIFGSKIANDMIPILKAGSDTLDEYTKEFEEVGYLSEEEVKALSEFDNVLNKIESTFKQLKIQLGASLLPVMESFAETINTKIIPKIQNFIKWLKSLSVEQQKFMVGILALLTALAPVLIIGGKLTSGIGSMIGLIGRLGATTKVAMGWIGLVIGLIALLYTRNEEFRHSLNKLLGTVSQALMPVFKLFTDILNQVAPLLGVIADIAGNILAPVLDMLVPIIEIVGKAFQWLYEILKPILSIINGIIDGITSIFGGGRKETKYNMDFSSVTSGGSSHTPIDIPEYKIPEIPTNAPSSDTIYDNSNININIEMTPTGTLDYDAKTLADEVIKQIVTKKQALGR